MNNNKYWLNHKNAVYAILALEPCSVAPKNRESLDNNTNLLEQNLVDTSIQAWLKDKYKENKGKRKREEWQGIIDFYNGEKPPVILKTSPRKRQRKRFYTLQLGRKTKGVYQNSPPANAKSRVCVAMLPQITSQDNGDYKVEWKRIEVNYSNFENVFGRLNEKSIAMFREKWDRHGGIKEKQPSDFQWLEALNLEVDQARLDQARQDPSPNFCRARPSQPPTNPVETRDSNSKPAMDSSKSSAKNPSWWKTITDKVLSLVWKIFAPFISIWNAIAMSKPTLQVDEEQVNPHKGKKTGGHPVLSANRPAEVDQENKHKTVKLVEDSKGSAAPKQDDLDNLIVDYLSNSGMSQTLGSSGEEGTDDEEILNFFN